MFYIVVFVAAAAVCIEWDWKRKLSSNSSFLGLRLLLLKEHKLDI